MILDTTGKSISIVLGEAKNINDCDLTVAFADVTATTFTDGSSDTTTNGVTLVTAVVAPAASTQRRVTQLSVFNNDTAQHTVTISLVDGTASRVLWKGALPSGQLLFYSAGLWTVLTPGIKGMTETVLLSGSGTYTTPVGCTRLKIRMLGGGGGGQGISNGVGYPGGGAGGNTEFGTVYANGSAGQTGGTAGSGTATVRITGTSGQNGSPASTNVPGGMGASALFGGGGGGGVPGGGAGSAAAANTGGGGGGAGGNTAWSSGPCYGGGAGEYVEINIPSPAATYSYAVGAGGAGGAGSSAAGGNGGSGLIIVEEYYGV